MTHREVGFLTITLLGKKHRHSEYVHIWTQTSRLRTMGNPSTTNVEKVGLNIGARIPGVFGEYSSLNVEINLLASKDDKDLHSQIESLTDEISSVLLPTMNKIAKICGKDPIFK